MSSWQVCFNALGHCSSESSMAISPARCLSRCERMAFMQVPAVMLSTMTVSQSPLARKALPASHHKAALSAARHLSQSFHMLRYTSFAMQLCGGHHYVQCISEPMSRHQHAPQWWQLPIQQTVSMWVIKLTDAIAVPAADNYLEGMALTEVCSRAVCISSTCDSLYPA